MKVKHLITALRKLPPNVSVDVSKFLSVEGTDLEKDGYEIHLDHPIIGLASRRDKTGKITEAVFVIEHGKNDSEYGKVVKIEG